jgi:hypothetical protein
LEISWAYQVLPERIGLGEAEKGGKWHFYSFPWQKAVCIKNFLKTY